MSHARIVLQTVGAQDTYLTKNAKHTHFKKNYRKHTLYGTDWNIINANYKNIDDYVSPNSRHYFRIENNGDLVKDIYLRIKINKDPAWSKLSFNVHETIFNILDSIEFLYNDKTLSKLTNDFIFSYFEVNYSESEKRNLIDMFSYDKLKSNNVDDHIYLTIPIPFWFHKSPGLAFPLWALNNPNVGVNINIKDFNKSTNKINDIELLVNFGQLTTIEKEQFSNKSLEYLIESVDQLNSTELVPEEHAKKIAVNKTHFIKYFLWNIQDKNNYNFNFLDDVESASITFNGNALIDNAPGSFYRSVNRYIHFKSAGNMGLEKNNGDIDEESLNPIYTYSFSVEPTSKKLSGYFTSEKFDNVTFDLKINGRAGSQRILNIYLVKYNIIRIHNGYLDILYN
tara:strand:- start:187 stop:1374 length:1188 start_codon:yes stop_codon:yes gene_type:complete